MVALGRPDAHSESRMADRAKESGPRASKPFHDIEVTRRLPEAWRAA